MGETDHCHVAVEDGASGGSDCQARGRGRSEVDDRSGKVGTISRDQEKLFSVKLMSRRVKTETDTAVREKARGQFAQNFRNGMLRLGCFLTIRDKETI